MEDQKYYITKETVYDVDLTKEIKLFPNPTTNYYSTTEELLWETEIGIIIIHIQCCFLIKQEKSTCDSSSRIK